MKALLLLILTFSGVASDLCRVPGGEFKPLIGDRDQPPTRVLPFEMQCQPVTVGEFLEFVKEEKKWQKGSVPQIFADDRYLQGWEDSLNPHQDLKAPVTGVSWYAARAYCQSLYLELPTIAQWEIAGMASEDRRDATTDPEFLERILNWYSRPTPKNHPQVQSTFANLYGIWDLHGLIWEWVLDFQSFLVTGESRQDASLDRGLFCGAAAERTVDASNYAAFMRYGLRSSLKASYTLPHLGFRCVREIPSQME